MTSLPYTFCPSDECAHVPELVGAPVIMTNGGQIGLPSLHYRCAAGHEYWIHEPLSARWAEVRAGLAGVPPVQSRSRLPAVGAAL